MQGRKDAYTYTCMQGLKDARTQGYKYIDTYIYIYICIYIYMYARTQGRIYIYMYARTQGRKDARIQVHRHVHIHIHMHIVDTKEGPYRIRLWIYKKITKTKQNLTY